MLIPRFTIRTLLVVMTLCALFAGTLSWAMGGAAWASAVASAASLLVVAFLIYGAFFFVVFGFAAVVRKTLRLTPPVEVPVRDPTLDAAETRAGDLCE